MERAQADLGTNHTNPDASNRDKIAQLWDWQSAEQPQSQPQSSGMHRVPVILQSDSGEKQNRGRARLPRKLLDPSQHLTQPSVAL